MDFPAAEVANERAPHRFFVRDDAEYDTLVQQYQAKTPLGKFFYLFMHVLPGLLAYVRSTFRWCMRRPCGSPVCPTPCSRERA